MRELIDVFLQIDEEVDASVLDALQSGFHAYQHDYFSNELSECKSSGQFDELLADLETIGSSLGVDPSSEIQRTQETKDEFEENESAYADHMQDEWKERSYSNRASEAEVREMFATLRSD